MMSLGNLPKVVVTTVTVVAFTIVAYFVVDHEPNRQALDQSSAPGGALATDSPPSIVAADEDSDSSVPDSSTAHSVNVAFRSLDDDSLSRVNPIVQARFFDDGPPRLYQRHRILEIDTEELRRQFEQAYLNRSEGGPVDSIQIPLFDDYTVSVVVNDRIDTGQGVISLYGQAQTVGAPFDSVEFHFSDAGRLEASMIPGDNSFLISNVADYTYYMVMQLETNTTID